MEPQYLSTFPVRTKSVPLIVSIAPLLMSIVLDSNEMALL